MKNICCPKLISSTPCVVALDAVHQVLHSRHCSLTYALQDVNRPLEVVSAADPRLVSRVELAVRFGKTLLVLECDGIEPMLFPLARKDLVHQGPRYVVQVGDKVRCFSGSA